MSTCTVRAKRWKHGWELHVDGVGVTQSRNLAGAEQMVRDYIETLTDHDTADDIVTIRPEVGSGLDEAAEAARDAISEAEHALRAAAARSRQVARQLSQEGLSGQDIAAILHVSAQRVSQLLKTTDSPSRWSAQAVVDALAEGEMAAEVLAQVVRSQGGTCRRRATGGRTGR
jgi:predicted XRE-type DNA-binding protein